MTTVGIIAEYNPFHNGHKHHIDAIRDQFGADTAVIVVMSGNYTQRGELAIAPKDLRAKTAIDCGANIVLELPFPFSMSSAEFFAKAGVKILNSLGVVDYISFGSESGDIYSLEKTAELIMSETFEEKVSELMKLNESKKLGYPQICDIALKQLSEGHPTPTFSTPNNILALEYIKAIKTFNSNIKIHTIKRDGAGYNEGYKAETTIQSATYIRTLIQENIVSAKSYIPDISYYSLCDGYSKGLLPSNDRKLSVAVISKLRLLEPETESDIHDTNNGLLFRLKDASLKTDDINTLVELCKTKKYTTARIRRAIWYLFFGVTSSDMKTLPLYTQILGIDTVGKALLKKIKKLSDFPILTKPSRTNGLSQDALRQKQFSDKADSIYYLTLPSFRDGADALRITPYVKDVD